MLVSFDEPEHFENVSGTMNKKLAALKAHKSQVGPEAIARIKTRARMLGKKGKFHFAEGFKKIELAH